MTRSVFFIFLGSVLVARSASSQVLNLYERMTDPRAIARLSVPDSEQTRSVAFHGDGRQNTDWSDTSGIVAQDTGSGVITHIWATAYIPDSAASIKLFINDTLVLSGNYRQVLGNAHGLFRPPLDSFSNDAYNYDVPIPFHHGFKLTVKTSNGDMYWAVQWHHVSGSVLPWLKIPLSNEIPPEQLAAEEQWQRWKRPMTIWNDTNAVQLGRTDTFQGPKRVVLQDVRGPAMLQEIQFHCSSFDTSITDSLWLNIYWDHSPQPSVHVPLKDFFLAPVVANYVRAHDVVVNSGEGFYCFFPMPFYDDARVELERTGSRPIIVSSTIQYHSESIDRNIYGYFHADFSESNPTKYHVNHPVIHTVGHGRYIGMSMGVFGWPDAVYLEGDPIFEIDSSPKYSIRYTGGEDYFDAGFWFPYGYFSLPLAGYTATDAQYYRFHYMDAYDFDRSFDFGFQHGVNTDVSDHYRTVGYYYKHWTPFWTSSDTIRAGMQWGISGAGYKPFHSIAIKLGPYDLSATSDSNGLFTWRQSVQASWQPGVYDLSVDGEIAPQKIFLLNGPAIRAITDTLPITLRAGDSLVVSGVGFMPGERVNFYLDSIPLAQSVTADSNYRLRTMLRVPYFPDRSYLLVARGAQSGNATAQDRVAITRTLSLEFEEMMPPVDTTPSRCWAQNISYYWDAVWSKQMLVYFEPDTPFVGGHVTFGFPIDHADTFAMNVHGSIGFDLGNYQISLDGETVKTFNFWFNNPGWDPQPSGAVPIGTHYLTAGKHTITFTCLGKSNSSRNYWVEPDVLVLTPTTYMPPLPGTILNSLDSPSLPGTAIASAVLHLNPNPNASSELAVSFAAPAGSEARLGTFLHFTLYDELGRSRDAVVTGSISEGEFHGTMSVADLPAGVYYLSTVIERADGYSAALSRARFIRE